VSTLKLSIYAPRSPLSSIVRLPPITPSGTLTEAPYYLSGIYVSHVTVGANEISRDGLISTELSIGSLYNI